MKKLLWILMGVLILPARLSFAEEITGKQVGSIPSFKISGFVDVYYSYNFNGPDSRFNRLRNFDIRDNQFGLNLAEVVVETTASPVGFRIDLDFGEATDWVHGGINAADGTAALTVLPHPGPSDPVGVANPTTETFKHVQQAYVSYSKGAASVDVGKFVTHLGAEVIETKDNWNYTRSLLFAWAIPYSHAGARAKYSVNDMLAISGFYYNGDGIVIDNNDGKTYGAQAALTLGKLGLVQNWIGGPEKADPGPSGDWRHTFDTVATLGITDKLIVMANYDYGWEDNAAVTGADDATWSGLALYAKAAVTDRLTVIPRIEYFDDHDGIRTGGATGVAGRNKMREATITGEYRLGENLLTRLEFRADHASEPSFDDKGGGLTDHQQTILLGTVYTF